MQDHSEFQPFPKMARLSRECTITEKIDGTNAQICIELAHTFPTDPYVLATLVRGEGSLHLRAGSRTRWLTLKEDNYGFAAWAAMNAGDLFDLGPGRHFGEWWGRGINRNYGQTDRKFWLFNARRWHAPGNIPFLSHVWEKNVEAIESSSECPPVCGVVPVLYRGPFNTRAIDEVIWNLADKGSVAAPGFNNPEGIVIFHSASHTLFKKTIKDDASPKGGA